MAAIRACGGRGICCMAAVERTFGSRGNLTRRLQWEEECIGKSLQRGLKGAEAVVLTPNRLTEKACPCSSGSLPSSFCTSVPVVYDACPHDQRAAPT